jgi:hypothetical protein
MPHIKLAEFVYDCSACNTRCDGISKGSYIFSSDAEFSESYEQIIIDKINRTGKYNAFKTEQPGYPDIEVHNKQNQLYCYVEVKVQQRSFMSIVKRLPQSNLSPSETVALNLSDLLRYFKIQKTSKADIIVTWVLKNRQCVVQEGGYKLFFQTARELEKIYKIEGAKRIFRRKSGDGDVVDGVHKGVTVNYHFSLNELKEWVW